VPPAASTIADDEVPPTASTSVDEVPPPSEAIMRGMFYFHASGPDRDDPLSMFINGKKVSYVREDDALNGTAARLHFIAIGRQREQLYWYTEYEAIITTKTIYVNWCMLSTGDVICGVWETRCNFPFQALLLCTKVSDYTKCVLIKCKEFRKKFNAATLTPGGRFDEDLVKCMCVCMNV
jgi:hypothetical protein